MSTSRSESIALPVTLRAFAAACCAALLLVLGGVSGCTHYRAGGPTAEESLPPSAKSDPELPGKKSSLPGEEQVGTVLLVVLLLAAAAGMAYLSFVVIPDAVH